jgi:hypothetical protein
MVTLQLFKGLNGNRPSSTKILRTQKVLNLNIFASNFIQ